MKSSTLRAQQGRSIVGQIVLALTVAAVMGGLFPGPALSKDNDRRDRPQERYHPPAHRAYRPAPRPQPYGYSQPHGYYEAPPPVVYVPPPSPGISLFFSFPR
jgi:hypothetical protein